MMVVGYSGRRGEREQCGSVQIGVRRVGRFKGGPL